MVCRSVPLPGGGAAIVCGPKPRARKCRHCPRPATLLCDWKVGDATCDAPICAGCAVSPAPEKHLCLRHRTDFEAWKARRAATGSAG